VLSIARVLLILEDEWEAMLLSKSLRDGGYETAVETSAQGGFDKAKSWSPDCILCSMSLPDLDGTWVARKVRSDSSVLAVTPFLLLASADEHEARLQAHRVGADVYLEKPIRQDEILAQVSALVTMAKRLSVRRSASSAPPNSASPVSSQEAPAFIGDLNQVSIGTVLTLLELERRTGRLKVRAGKSEHRRTATFEITDGHLVLATLETVSAPLLTVMREVLRWKEGRVSFRALRTPPKGKKEPIGAILLEAARLEDESHR
jgi:two-component system OmpR family response regulator